MDARTKEESARPLGVIGSLAAGFEMIGQHLSLIALPVLLDLLLWLGPRVSIASLVKQFAAFLLSRPAPDPTTVGQVAQMAQLIEQFGERSNLLALLSALPLLTVPSLLAQHAPGVVSPLGEPYVLSTASVLAVMAWAVVLVPIGLVLGFLYLNSLARWVHAMRSSDKQAPALSVDEGPAPGADRRSIAERPALSKADGVKKAFRVSDSVGKFLRVFLFTAALLASGMMLAPLWMLLVGTILATVPLLGMLVWSLSIGLGSYIVLHLLFVVPGVLVGGRGLLRAIWESILLIHTQFSSVVGLVLLVVVIYQGLGFVWSLPSGDSWLLLIGILGNGCIATGLTAALFVFYQERVGQLPGAPQVSAGS
jgi:hypothetical protein